MAALLVVNFSTCLTLIFTLLGGQPKFHYIVFVIIKCRSYHKKMEIIGNNYRILPDFYWAGFYIFISSMTLFFIIGTGRSYIL